MNENYEAALKAALSGAVSGGLLGAGGRFLAGGKKVSELLKSGLLGGSVGSGIAGGSTLAGTSIMGPPTQEEANPYTYRSGLGGAVLGGLGGAGLAALMASGKFPARALNALGKHMPVKNLLTDKLMAYGKSPSMGGLRKAAAMGGVAGGVPSALMAADEGMGVDVLMRELEDRKKKEYLERIMSDGY